MRVKIGDVYVEGTPEEIARLLEIEKGKTKKKKYCSCYEEDPTGYYTTYHRVRNGCSECRGYEKG
jgi:hypothetical protein